MTAIIAAIAENGVIGRENRLPWHLPRDLRFFRDTTIGHTIVFGRKTFESLCRGSLPGRRNIVITERRNYESDGIEVFHSLSAVLEAMTGDDEVFICGGAELYAAALPLVEQLYLTRVAATPVGDVMFPEVDWSEWQLATETRHRADERNAYDLTFQLYRQSIR